MKQKISENKGLGGAMDVIRTTRGPNNPSLMKMASVASVTVAIILIVTKAVTYLLTGSMAILSTLLDSIQDSLTSIINFFAVKQAVEPADAKHRFGHGKAQAVGSLVQATIIGIAGAYLIFASVKRLVDPVPVTDVQLAVAITVMAIILTAFLLLFQSYVIRRTNSLSIRTDRAHYVGDIALNAGVIVSILMSHYLQWDFVDSLFGVCVGIYLMSFVYKISKEACAMLMDAEIPRELRGRIREIVNGFPDVIDMAHLKTRYSGNHIFIQFTIYLKDGMTLKKAHAVTDRIEEAIGREFKESDTMIHPEPISHKGKKP